MLCSGDFQSTLEVIRDSHFHKRASSASAVSAIPIAVNRDMLTPGAPIRWQREPKKLILWFGLVHRGEKSDND
jgi:hypothetical protein